MSPNLQFPVDLVTFTEEILNGKLHFLEVHVEEPVQHLWFSFFAKIVSSPS